MQKLLINLLYRFGTHLTRNLLIAGLLVVCLLLLRSTTWYETAYYHYLDDDPNRGAATVSEDVFGDSFSKVVYLDQGWEPEDSLWYYNTTQGSDLMPYDFFIALEQVDSEKLFRSPEHMNYYRYLPQAATKSNPDALPVGMVADWYDGKKYMGFTCAACHTSQVNYNGNGIRIDGGPSAADMDSFMLALEQSLATTKSDNAKKKRFVDAVLDRGEYRTQTDVEKDLEIYYLRIQAYNFFNESRVKRTNAPVHYGYARLDAFGRIYNRVLEHVLDRDAIRTILRDSLPHDEVDKIVGEGNDVLSDTERDEIMAKLSLLPIEERRKLRDQIFNPPNAPVSYPFLWDIPQHDYVQWNGIAANAGLGPIGRNTGEVIGVFGTLDWEEKPGWSISSVINGQGFGPTHISYRSSVDVQNLRQIEDQLWDLTSPSWQDGVKKAGLPDIDAAKWERGELLFDKHCSTCHATIDRTSETRRIIAHMDRLSVAGTDKRMAANSVSYGGFSGFLRNQYVGIDVGSVLIDVKAPVAAMLTKTTQGVVATPDPDKWFFTRGADWLVNLIKGFVGNKIKPSLKTGSYKPDTTASPFEYLKAYKGRSLNGIWATAPYLHNGSVPTLYDLLLPAKKLDNDPEDMQYRPEKFMVGARELDVEKVGFKHGLEEYDGFLFDTSLPANHNTGHEYGARVLTEDERWDLVEYLKSL